MHWVLVSDVDETLLGDDEALVLLGRHLKAHSNIRVVLNSSRPIASIRKSIDALPQRVQEELPASFPWAIVGAMGSEIEIDGCPSIQKKLREWPRRFTNWDRAQVDRLMSSLGYQAHTNEFQAPYKASFSVPRSDWSEVKFELRQQGIRAKVIGSGRDDLDILPVGAGKGEATRWLAESFSIPRERLIAAGDSANDLELFAVTRFGIAVGNARHELLERLPASTYRARAARAAGVLEGLVFYGVIEEAEERLNLESSPHFRFFVPGTWTDVMRRTGT